MAPAAPVTQPAGPGLNPAAVLALQRAAGNRAATASILVQRAGGDGVLAPPVAPPAASPADAEAAADISEAVLATGEVATDIASEGTAALEASGQSSNSNEGNLAAGLLSGIGAVHAVRTAWKGKKLKSEATYEAFFAAKTTALGIALPFNDMVMAAAATGPGVAEAAAPLAADAVAGASTAVPEASTAVPATEPAAAETPSGAGADFKNWGGTVGGALDVLKQFVDTCRKAKEDYDAYQEGRTGETNAKAVGGFVSRSVEAARTAARTVKDIMETFAATPSGALMTAIPGIGTVVRAVKAALSVAAMIFARGASSSLGAMRKAIEDRYRGENSWFTRAKGTAAAPHDRRAMLEWIRKQSAEWWAQTRDGTGGKLQEHRREVAGDMDRYLALEDLEYINEKRFSRGALNTSENLVGLSAEISALTPAVAVSLPLRAIATGINLGGKGIRIVKQSFVNWSVEDAADRNVFERAVAKIGSLIGRSTADKERAYKHNAAYIMSLAGAIDMFDGAARATAERTVDHLVYAAGADTAEFWSLKTPEERSELLIKAQHARD